MSVRSRGKRLRVSPTQDPATSGSAGDDSTKAAVVNGNGNATDTGDHLPVDPSAMTERQQLAFLLRTTAQEASSDGDAESATRGVATNEPVVKKRKNTKRSTASTIGKNEDTDAKSKSEPSRNRLSKRKAKAKKKLHIETSAIVDHSVQEQPLEPTSSTRVQEKTSPASANDAIHMQVFDSDVGVWSMDCALCCARHGPGWFPSEALFLCSSCDRKYPTQRALGIV